MARFVTQNSVYLVEDDRYMRLPKDESYRSANESWRLADGAWHPLERWSVENVYGDGNRLRLWTPDAVYGIITSVLEEEE